ncbi:MAG: nuclear transport factor 2 family protein [Dehalococcoidia bacterium]|nr:nuclear transport factor 2 family protein [Dehalococcoidia bacterium]
MADLAEIEARMKRLEDIEAIKALKHKYFRCLDSKLWNEMAECFTEDATTSYSGGKYSFQGVDAIMQFLKEGLVPTMISMHHGHHPEIELTSDTTARGIWALQSYVIDRQANLRLMEAAFYQDEYVKVKGEWKIKHTGYNCIFEEMWDRGKLPV